MINQKFTRIGRRIKNKYIFFKLLLIWLMVTMMPVLFPPVKIYEIICWFVVSFVWTAVAFGQGLTVVEKRLFKGDKE